MRNTYFLRRFPVLSVMGTVVALAMPVALAPATAKAAGSVDVYIEDAIITSPTSTLNGSLDVYFTVTPDYAPMSFGYNAEITLSSSSSGVTFLAPTPTTSNHPEAAYPAANFVDSGSTTTTLLVGDDADEAIPLTNGEGLFEINYSVAANTTGIFNLNFPSSPINVIDDQDADPLPVTFHGGTITISAIPEPASLALLGLCAPLLLRRRRRVA